MANNSTMIIQTKASNPIQLDQKELRAASYTFDSPFQLELPGGHCFVGEQVVRVLPGKRMVVFGTWQGHAVVAKLFFERRRAHRHMQADAQGIKTLHLNKVPAPILYYEGPCNQPDIYIVIYEKLSATYQLDQLLSSSENDQETFEILQRVMIEIATQHVLGIKQQDLHLENFLVTEKHIYTLDGAQISIQERMLNKKDSVDNLALLLAQFGVGHETLQINLFNYYAEARGWMVKRADYIYLQAQLNKINQYRWQKYEKKIFRHCSDFAPLPQRRYHGMYASTYQGQAFMQLLQDPESYFLNSDKQVLKAGHSATVIKVMVDGRELVIKRYNTKNTWHFLRRCLRATRAENCWRIAHKLCLFGVATAKPIAYLEKCFCGLRGKSYYISEYVSGGHVGEFLNGSHDVAQSSVLIKRLVACLKSLAKLKITHGDLKITNFLLDSKLQPVLIDLDGAIEHDSAASLYKTWHKEIRRFLRNFANQPALSQQFEQEFRS